MNLLTRLVLKEWFKALIGALVVLFLLITTADIINGFLRGKTGAQVLLEYALKMPDLMGKMLPVCCLLASLFSLNRLKSQNELIAIFASGLSIQRLHFLIGTAAITIVALQFSNLGFLEPYANKIKRQEIRKSKINEGKYLTRSAVDGSNFWYKSDHYFATFTVYDRKQQSLKNLKLYYFDNDHRTVSTLETPQAEFTDGKWLAKNVRSITQLDGMRFPKFEKNLTTHLEIKELPSDFTEFESDLTTLSYPLLSNFIEKISRTGINTNEYRILLYQKIALSILCLIFALLPLGTAANPNRRSDSFGKNVAFTLIFTVLFWLLFSSSLSMGQSGKAPAWVATSIVPLIFAIYIGWRYHHQRKLTF